MSAEAPEQEQAAEEHRGRGRLEAEVDHRLPPRWRRVPGAGDRRRAARAEDRREEQRGRAAVAAEEREPVGSGLGPRREPELRPRRAQHGEEGARHDAAEMRREAHARVRHLLDERAHYEAEEEEEDAVPEETAP